jgi:hypothetical protein
MVCGPSSRPLLESSSRSPTIRSIVDCASRVGLVRGRRARLEGVLALGAVAGHQPRDPTLGYPVLAGYLGLAAALDDNGGND